MSDSEKIEALENRIKELESKIEKSKYVRPWDDVRLYMDKKLFKSFNEPRMNPRINQVKQSINQIIAKSFCKDSVLNLNQVECDEAIEIIDTISEFIERTRSKYRQTNSVSGYERKFEEKEV